MVAGLEGMLRNLKLYATERKGIKVGATRVSSTPEGEWQAVGKVLSEKMVYTESILQTVGKIWCPSKGIVCKELGDNLFLLHFNEPKGAKRALVEGPWMAGHSLVVLVPYDGNRALRELEFHHIPIWICVSNIPMGMMNKQVAEIIGDDIGKFMDVDVEENGTAVGCYLRVKVRIDIHESILRGVTLLLGEGNKEKERVCPLEYEFLPKFCYSYGIIGHIDKNCTIKEQT
ncbi:hypothetical protein BAE44_0011090 [Dichanthelium oligosanthes]|uniref:DUF4283 domain-containing protein n=1 Tax=Dichanthelium oligosanthes TaxID=888268 RepID=A0A1E5VS28_9POAL|nr:hypothetical protein BAE44_0011090 [Dichanthelium oligosanthes]